MTGRDAKPNEEFKVIVTGNNRSVAERLNDTKGADSL